MSFDSDARIRRSSYDAGFEAGRAEAEAEIAALKAERDRLQRSLQELCIYWRSRHFDSKHIYDIRPSEEICADELETLLSAPASGQASCVGYPACDGDLPGETHEPECPASGQKGQ